VTLNDLERRNGRFALFHRIHVQCRLKTIGLPPFQNLLLIVYDDINYDLRDFSASIWAKQQEANAIASTSDCSCLRPCLLSPDEFLVAMGVSICGGKRVGRASPF